MGTGLWTALFWLMAAAVITLFVLQSVYWAAMRTRRIAVARWRTMARLWLASGLLLLAIGCGLYLLVPLRAYRALVVCILGGTLNAFVAAFHLRVVAYLSRRP